VKRSNTVRLVVRKELHAKLRELATWTAKCWNEVNWLRTQQFKEEKRVDFNNTERKVYAKYKEHLKVNTSQVCRKNAEAWRSFFALLREKKEDKSLKPRPPGYWKGKRERKMILIRNDRYTVVEGSRTIYLKDFHLSLGFKGRLNWKGKQGRLEIFHDGFHWYATIPVEVELNESARGDGIAGIDLGIVNLATLTFDDGTWVLFKGGSALSQYENYSRKITLTQRKLSAHGQTGSKKLRALYLKRRFLKHTRNSLVRRTLKIAHGKGVSTMRVGYPRKIAHHGNKLTVNFWNYNYTMERLMEVSEEYGIKVIPVNEAYTSRSCSMCGEVHNTGRVFRGLFKCPHTGRTINADLNGAINILHIPESQGGNEGFPTGPTRGIGVNWLKTQPLVYRWTSGAGWVTPTSHETMKVKAVNHKPVNRSKGTLAL